MPANLLSLPHAWRERERERERERQTERQRERDRERESLRNTFSGQLRKRIALEGVWSPPGKVRLSISRLHCETECTQTDPQPWQSPVIPRLKRQYLGEDHEFRAQPKLLGGLCLGAGRGISVKGCDVIQ